MTTPTPEETLAALKESIAHWERLASGNRHPNEDIVAKDCALCKLFLGLPDTVLLQDCEGCPVRIKTGVSYCRVSPWADASRAAHKFGLDSEQFKEAALVELDFLKSLLPKENKPA